MSTAEIESKCRELRELQALIDEAQTEADAIRDVLKAAMGTETELRAGEPVKSVKLDVRALKAALPDVAARFSRESTTRRFCVA